jgi:hypothetical protein
MRRTIGFWFATLMRGVAAMLVGCAIWFVPDMAGSLLLLPMAFAFSVLTLAAYGVVDSMLVLWSSMMSRSRRSAVALRVQGGLGIVVGVLLFAVVYARVQLEWFFLLAGVQALCLGATELIVARHTISHAKAIWSYAAAAVALCFGCAYLSLRFLVVDVLSPRQICWLIYGYLLVFGSFQSVNAARMLFRGHHAGSLADRASGRGSMRTGECTH